MKLLIFFFTLSAAISIVAAAYLDSYNQEILEIDESEAALPDTEEETSLRGVRHLAAKQSVLSIGVCDKFPRVCRLKTSPGPDCCKKKCVNVKTDRANCGQCGYKCKYTEICCRGQCVNVSFDKRHCGGCRNKCKKGEFCVYGMCNYA